MAAPQLSYAVPPHEQGYYEGLFQAADRSRAGAIKGSEAVPFFSLSKLTVDTLKNIWTLSDQPPSNSLDRRKFSVAVRLIQLAQNGVKAQGAQLQGPPGMRPAMFEGISGVSVPLPPPEGPPQQQFAQPPPPQQQQQYAQPPPQQQQYAQPPQQQQQYAQPPPPQQQQPPQQQYAQPPPQQQQQQYAQPPPQQQQRAPTPIAQAAPLSPPRPPTPSRPPMGGGPPAFSMALTPQDPYTMTPQEQARYEGIFPTYTGPDGFVHGKEAVDLFSKSNIPKDKLGAIWNLVDTPVDNKLDKLEFAMAMHLIVCVSKKNLPVPSALPISLKMLKSQQPAPQVPNAPPALGQEPPLTTAPSQEMSPQRQSFTVPPPVQPQMQYQVPPPVVQQQYSAPPSPQQRYSTPPPLQPPGGGAMAISDAFEGLTPANAARGYDEPVSFDATPAMPSMGYNSAATSSIPEPDPQPSYTPAPAPIPPPKSTEQLASSYRMGDDSEELKKLRITLQRLQAENVALRAQMGSMTEDEREVQKEAMATIAEISRLSSELNEVRAQVLSTKTRLLESSAELAAAKEKKAVMTDLISEAKATKEVMEVATNDLYTVTETLHSAPAPPPAPVVEEDLFGGWGAPAPASGATWGSSAPSVEDDEPYQPPVQQFKQQLAVSTSSYDSGDGFVASAPAPAPYTAAPIALQAYGQDPLDRSAPTRGGVESAKKAAIEADKKAKEADETYRAIAQETESLRKIAEAAEAEAMAKHEKAAAKRMGKKRLLKEAEEASIEAADKKKHFLEMQAQTSNAQSLANASRQEAERLRNFAEQTEIEYASAESTKDSAPTHSVGGSSNTQAWGIPDPSTMSYSSYGIDQSKAASAFGNVQGYGNGMPAHMTMQPQVSQASDDSHNFGGGVMGGGNGLSIPTPSAADDYNYSNPF